MAVGAGNGSGNGDAWERRAKTITNLVGNVGFAALMAAALLWLFSTRLQMVSETLVAVRGQLQQMSAVQADTARNLASLAGAIERLADRVDRR